jgi:gag-polypeptide of LTR copia-type
MFLQVQVITTKLLPGNPVNAQVEEMILILSRSAAMNVKISNDKCKLAFLRSISNSYECLIVTLENLIDNLRVEDIHARIIRDDLRQINMN